MSHFLERLNQGTVLFDGAMGTSLHQMGVRSGSNLDEINLTDPHLVETVHRRYLEAGADVIQTNTFGANEIKLTQHGLADRVYQINEAGVEIARHAIEKNGRAGVFVAGGVSPLGAWIAPVGRISEERAYRAFRSQINALILNAVDLIVLETFSDLHEIQIAIKAARDLSTTIPIMAQMTFTRDDLTILGETPAQVAEALATSGADVIGVNCSGGPSQILRIASIFHTVVPNTRISAQPNAGFPEQIDGRFAYPAQPDYFGEYALAFEEAGICVVGGCCGTTPAHIRAMRDALDDEARPYAVEVKVPKPNEITVETPLEQPTKLSQMLAHGEFVSTVEVAPPRSYTPQRVIATAEMLRDAGIKFINVSDAPLARMRMSPWAVAHLIQDRLGMETVLHFPVRGRNLLRIQGDLLAAHALNVRNVFVTMGDPTKIGDYPDSFDTHDVVPTGLVKLLSSRLNEGIDQAGNSLGQPTRFTVGAALDMNPQNMEKQLKLARKKIDNGANFLLSQPVFEPEKVPLFRKAYEDYFEEPLTTPIIAGLLPLFTIRHANFLHNEVPGMSIPVEIRQRLEHANTPAEEGVLIAQEILLTMREHVQGVYFMPPFGRYYLAAEVAEVLQATPQ